MKNIKLLIVAAFITIGMLSLAGTDATKYDTSKKVVHMTLLEAVQIYWLDMILQELDSDFLSTQKPVYTIDVPYLGYTARVSGSYNQWAWYFRPNGVNIDNPVNLKNIKHR